VLTLPVNYRLTAGLGRLSTISCPTTAS